MSDKVFLNVKDYFKQEVLKALRRYYIQWEGMTHSSKSLAEWDKHYWPMIHQIEKLVLENRWADLWDYMKMKRIPFEPDVVTHIYQLIDKTDNPFKPKPAPEPTPDEPEKIPDQ